MEWDDEWGYVPTVTLIEVPITVYDYVTECNSVWVEDDDDYGGYNPGGGNNNGGNNGNNGNGGTGEGDNGTGNEDELEAIYYVDAESREKLEDIIEGLKDDCMGGPLIAWLDQFNTPINYDPTMLNFGVARADGSITISVPLFYVIVEELVHAYQYRTFAVDKNNKANIEIQAKVCVYRYAERHNLLGELPGINWEGIKKFSQKQTTKNYERALTDLRDSGYTEEAYPDNPDYRNLNTVIYLLEDC